MLRVTCFTWKRALSRWKSTVPTLTWVTDSVSFAQVVKFDCLKQGLTVCQLFCHFLSSHFSFGLFAVEYCPRCWATPHNEESTSWTQDPHYRPKSSDSTWTFIFHRIYKGSTLFHGHESMGRAILLGLRFLCCHTAGLIDKVKDLMIWRISLLCGSGG